MQLSSHNWSLTLDLNGGRIHDLFFKNQKVFGTYNRIDGKQGNTHLCVPSFDKEGIEKYNLPFHGLIRTNPWIEEFSSETSIQISTLTAPSKSYPASLLVTQTFELGSSFSHKISVVHLTGEPVPLNCAIHYYWDTPNGWSEIKIQNQNQKENIESNGYISLEEKNSVQFPHANYELISNGFGNAVLWTSFIDSQEGKKYSQDFCCIEPVVGWPNYFGSEKSIVRKGESKTFSLEVSAGERT